MIIPQPCSKSYQIMVYCLLSPIPCSCSVFEIRNNILSEIRHTLTGPTHNKNQKQQILVSELDSNGNLNPSMVVNCLRFKNKIAMML